MSRANYSNSQLPQADEDLEEEAINPDADDDGTEEVVEDWRLSKPSGQDPYGLMAMTPIEEEEFNLGSVSTNDVNNAEPEPNIILNRANPSGAPTRLRVKSGSIGSENMPKHPFVINAKEDPMAILTPADENFPTGFGGLILGYEGTKPHPPGEDFARGFLFNPNQNMGPQYPGDLKMTPFCIPRPMRKRAKDEGLSTMGTMRAEFDPPFAKDQEPQRDSIGGISDTLEHPEELSISSGSGDDDNLGEQEEKKDVNIFAFFGKPQPIPPIDCPAVFSTSEETVLAYLDAHNLESFLEHVVSLCVLQFHPEPFVFIANYCQSLMEARVSKKKFKTLTRVFNPEHVEAVYRIFDKPQNGWVSVDQYRIGMELLGLTRYKVDPKGYKENTITKETFIKEGCKHLDLLLRSFMS